MKHLIIISILLLAACTRDYTKQDITYCSSLGFKENTDAFANCRLQMNSIRAQRMAAMGILIKK